MSGSRDDEQDDTTNTFFLEPEDEDGGPIGGGEGAAPHPYDREIVRKVWTSAEAVEGNDAELWRKDEFGAWIYLLDFGNRNSEFGWEIIDHSPWRRGLGISLLRPCQWQNYLDYDSTARRHRITSRGLKNVRELL